MNKNILKRVAVFVSVIMVLVAVVPVVPVEAASVQLNKTAVTIVKGKTYTLKVKNAKKVKWSSSKKSVATVNSKGKVTAKKKGTATITAKVGKKKYKCKVTVVNAKLSATKKSVTVGEKFTLKVTGAKADKWKSSNAKIATVNSKGKVTGKKAGKVKIYAYVGVSKLTCTVTVKKKTSNNSEKTETNTELAELNSIWKQSEKAPVYSEKLSKLVFQKYNALRLSKGVKATVWDENFSKSAKLMAKWDAKKRQSAHGDGIATYESWLGGFNSGPNPVKTYDALANELYMNFYESQNHYDAMLREKNEHGAFAVYVYKHYVFCVGDLSWDGWWSFDTEQDVIDTHGNYPDFHY